MWWIRKKKFKIVTHARDRVLLMREELIMLMKNGNRTSPEAIRSFEEIAPEDSAGYIRWYFLNRDCYWADNVFDLADMIRYGPINRTFPRPSAIQYVVW